MVQPKSPDEDGDDGGSHRLLRLLKRLAWLVFALAAKTLFEAVTGDGPGHR
jgi:hypothetical protein